MKTIIPFILTLFLLCSRLMAQPNIEWQKCLGGTGSDDHPYLTKTSDGGFVSVSMTSSNDGDVVGNHGSNDFWLIKFNSEGATEWKKTYGGTKSDAPSEIIQTPDGGYLMVGNSLSNNGDVSINRGQNDFWVVKTDGSGNLQWQKTYGGGSIDAADAVISTSEGGYLVAGTTQSQNGNVTGFHGGVTDAWVIKISPIGNLEWQKCYGGTGNESFRDIIIPAEGGFILVGSTSSTDGDVIGNHGSIDFWMVKIGNSGLLEWQKCFGGSQMESAYEIHKINQNGFIIVGSTESNNGDVNGGHGNYDAWIIKLDNNSNFLWKTCFGGSQIDYGTSLKHTLDGGFIVSGISNSTDGNLTLNNGGMDVWVLKLDSVGNLEWQKSFGGSSQEDSYSIIQTNDGGYVFGAKSLSSDGDLLTNQGIYDQWLVKLSPTITEAPSLSFITNMEVLPNPSKGIFSLKTNASMLGKGFNVFNSLGKKVASGAISTESTAINLENQATGIYSIRFDGDGNRSLRIVKE